ncbi:MAG: PAS domain S-box protein [Gammaproteobacteria bacterium]|nr:PAS domain S-box protein [Gammaproteobacteria bacterium]
MLAARTDITERKALESAAATLPLEMIGLDRELRITWINRSAANALGQPPAELVGQAWFELCPDLAPRRSLYERVLAGESFDFERVDLITPTGQQLALATSLRPVPGRDGKVDGIMIMARDVGALHQALAERRRAERRLTVLVEKCHDLITVLSRDGVIEYQSPACRRRLGFGPDELVGQNAFDYVHPDDLAELRRRFTAFLAGPDDVAAAPVEARFRHAQGGWCWLEIVATHAFDDPAIGGLVVVSRSIDGRKLAEAEIAANRALLEHAIIEASNFEQQRIAGDLHDGLGQELTGIALLLRAAGARLPERPAEAAVLLREAGGLIDGAVQSARELAHGLAPATIERGGLPGALADLARRLRRTQGIRAQFRKRIAAPLRLDTTQATHLYRIAQEGVSNAVRHGGATFITLRLRADGETLRLEIVDNGSGLPAPERRSASGMGLRIMEYRARMLGGELRLSTPRRGGTVVACRIPLAKSG